ncbi:hypothetical protein [Mycobacteroides abscessus]|uniref:hypothetical protein n=1 Tax=Mycobacteroides abscessus TaxID=36809 RepID=UPI0010573FC2|nr:hypothetical protein [Mycobacteroides abscessus]
MATEEPQARLEFDTIAEEAESFWHAVFEGQRSPDGEFGRDITIVVAHALLATTAVPVEGFGTRELLLCLRKWYGSRMERLSILWFMSHYRPDAEVIASIAHAIAANHSDECADPEECVLHSLGRLWAMDWINPTENDKNWFPSAITQLVQEHPLRQWTMFLPYRCAETIEDGGLTHQDVAAMLTSAANSGLLSRLANPDSLDETWVNITKDSPADTWDDFARFGNRAVANGATNLAGAHLDFLRRTGRI